MQLQVIWRTLKALPASARARGDAVGAKTAVAAPPRCETASEAMRSPTVLHVRMRVESESGAGALTIPRSRTGGDAPRRRAAASAEVETGPFAIGSRFRYAGLGACVVTEHLQRPFRGRQQCFAHLRFPHRELSAQVPIEDEQIKARVLPLSDPALLRRELHSLTRGYGGYLHRTWDGREHEGRRRLREGDPAEWLALLRDYAHAERDGMVVAASDGELVGEAVALLAAEIACAEGCDYECVRSEIGALYRAAAGEQTL